MAGLMMVKTSEQHSALWFSLTLVGLERPKYPKSFPGEFFRFFFQKSNSVHLSQLQE